MSRINLCLFITLTAMLAFGWGVGVAVSNAGELVAHYPLDTDASDATGNGHNGVAHGPVFASGGHSGGACEFDGIDDYIQIPTHSALETAHFTVSLWAKSRLETTEQDRGLIGKHRCFDNISYYWIYQQTDHLSGTMAGSQFNQISRTQGPLTPILNEWGMVTMTYDGNKMRLYVNGDLKSEENCLGHIGNTYDLLIGAGEWAFADNVPQRWWSGWIDDVKIYNYALSSNQVVSLYNGEAPTQDGNGSVTAAIQPSDAVLAGARWRLTDGGNWQLPDSPLTNQSPGGYTVTFKPIPGWITPPDQTVIIPPAGGVCVTGLYAAAAPTGTLVLYYNFNEDHGAVIPDISGNNNTGYVHGATFTSGGIDQGCYTFNGVSDYIRTPDRGIFDTTQFTVSVWAQTRESIVLVDRGILGKHRCFDNISYYWIHQRTNQLTCIMDGNTFGDLRSLQSPVSPFYNTWGMATLSYDGQWMRLYINGALVGEESCVGYTGNGYDLLIGAGEFAPGSSLTPQRWWNGMLDEVRIYNSAMSADQILSLYTSYTNSYQGFGTVACTLTPAEAVSAGATWRLASSATWLTSNDTVTNAPIGTQRITFSEVPGWIRPADQWVNVTAGATNNVTVLYTRPQENDLVLYYDFNTNGASVMPDKSGYGNHGSVTDATFTNDGILGGAYVFNGSNAYIRTPNNASHNVSNFTISVWAKTFETTTSIDSGILGKHRCFDNTHYYWILQRTNQIAAVMGSNPLQNNQTVQSSISPFYNEWGMATLTYDGQWLRLYVNGLLTSETPCTDYSGNGYDLLIGAGEFSGPNPDKPWRWWHGCIDELRIYKRAFNASEITNLYLTTVAATNQSHQPPQIISIDPPSGSFTFDASIQMMIMATSYVDGVNVDVDGCKATPNGNTQWSHLVILNGPAPTSETFTVRATDGQGNCTSQFVTYSRINRLRLSAFADGLWHLVNPNSIPVDYTWNVLDQTENGSGTAPANSQVSIETSAGQKILRVYVNGTLSDQKAWNPKPVLNMSSSNGSNSKSQNTSPFLCADDGNPANQETLQLRWQGVIDQVYTLQYTTNLMSDWTTVSGYPKTGQGDWMSHNVSVMDMPTMYFRLQVSCLQTNGLEN